VPRARPEEGRGRQVGGVRRAAAVAAAAVATAATTTGLLQL
jgi:hypothetical protein